MLISLKLYICTRYLSLFSTASNKVISAGPFFSSINSCYGQGKEICSAPYTRILQGSEKGSARIGLALLHPSTSASANLISVASAMDENGGPAGLNDIAFCGGLPVSTS